MALVRIAALLVAALIAALAVPAWRAARHHTAVARRHAAIHHRVGAGRDRERVVTLGVRHRSIDRAVGAGRCDHHPGHRRKHARARQTVRVALNPHPVAELRRLSLGGKTEGETIIVLAGAARGIGDLRRAARWRRIAVARVADGIVAGDTATGQRRGIGRGHIVP